MVSIRPRGHAIKHASAPVKLQWVTVGLHAKGCVTRTQCTLSTVPLNARTPPTLPHLSHLQPGGPLRASRACMGWGLGLGTTNVPPKPALLATVPHPCSRRAAAACQGPSKPSAWRYTSCEANPQCYCPVDLSCNKTVSMCEQTASVLGYDSLMRKSTTHPGSAHKVTPPCMGTASPIAVNSRVSAHAWCQGLAWGLSPSLLQPRSPPCTPTPLPLQPGCLPLPPHACHTAPAIQAAVHHPELH